MALVNENGLSVSYECGELIEELKEDIAEFGADTMVAVWFKKTHGVEVITNYDFIEEEIPLTQEELREGEYVKPMTMAAVLVYLKKQNEIF